MDIEKLKEDCEKVAVFPDGDTYPVDEIPSWKSDDYEMRYQSHCMQCETAIKPHYDKPFASCECGTQEWFI